MLPGQPGINHREKRVSEWVAKVLPLAKPGVWGCVQARSQWSTEEDVFMRPGHHWLCEFGDVGNDTNCVNQFNLEHLKWEDYRDTHSYTIKTVLKGILSTDNIFGTLTWECDPVGNLLCTLRMCASEENRKSPRKRTVSIVTRRCTIPPKSQRIFQINPF